MDYNPRTLDDLSKIKKLKETLDFVENQVKEIKDNCPHFDHKVEFIETLTYEYTPKLLCVVCDKVINIRLTREEMMKLWKNFFSDFYNKNCTDEYIIEVTNNLRGYNLPRPSLRRQ